MIISFTSNSLELSDFSIGLAKIFAEKSNSKSEMQILENLKSIFAKFLLINMVANVSTLKEISNKINQEVLNVI